MIDPAEQFSIDFFRRYHGTGAACVALIKRRVIGSDGVPVFEEFGKPFRGHSHADVWNQANDWLIATELRAADLDQINGGALG